MKSPNKLLVAQEPRIFGPNANKSARHGRWNALVTHPGPCVEISGSCKRFMTMPSKPNTPPAAIKPLEYSAPGLASPPSFFLGSSLHQPTYQPARKQRSCSSNREISAHRKCDRTHTQTFRRENQR